MFKKFFTLLLIVLMLCVPLSACAKPSSKSRDFNHGNIDYFFVKVNEINKNTDMILNEFAKNYQVNDEFLSKIEAVEQQYINLIDYTKTLTTEEYQHEVPKRGSVKTILENGWLREPIMETKYSSKMTKNGWYYSGGSIHFEEGYCIDVIHMQNVTATSETLDYSKERIYKVNDASKDAYLVLSGELGLQIIRITAR